MIFYKFQALANDFVLLFRPPPLSSQTVIQLCHRKKGVGADGVILLYLQKQQIYFRVYNADGGSTEMCGNGLRCAAVLAYQLNIVKLHSKFLIKTIKRDVFCYLDEINLCTINMGKSFECRLYNQHNKKIKFNNSDLIFHECNMGNPHCVIFLQQNLHHQQLCLLEQFDIQSLKYIQEISEIFPESTNIELVRQNNKGQFYCRVLQRGVGETMGCGSGACAIASVVFRKRNIVERLQVDIAFKGGKLNIVVQQNGQILMKGPAHRVYEGKLASNYDSTL